MLTKDVLGIAGEAFHQLGGLGPRVVRVVLREAIRPDELRDWLDAAFLRQVWPELYLPRSVRRAREDRHPELRTTDAVA